MQTVAAKCLYEVGGIFSIGFISPFPIQQFANLNPPSYGIQDRRSTLPKGFVPEGQVLKTFMASWVQGDMMLSENCILAPKELQSGEVGQRIYWEYLLVLSSNTAIVIFSLLLRDLDPYQGEAFSTNLPQMQRDVAYRLDEHAIPIVLDCVSAQFGGRTLWRQRRARLGMTFNPKEETASLIINTSEPLNGLRGLVGANSEATERSLRTPLEVGLTMPPYIEARVGTRGSDMPYEITLTAHYSAVQAVLGAYASQLKRVAPAEAPIWLPISFEQANTLFEHMLVRAAWEQSSDTQMLGLMP